MLVVLLPATCNLRNGQLFLVSVPTAKLRCTRQNHSQLISRALTLHARYTLPADGMQSKTHIQSTFKLPLLMVVLTRLLACPAGLRSDAAAQGRPAQEGGRCTCQLATGELHMAFYSTSQYGCGWCCRCGCDARPGTSTAAAPEECNALCIRRTASQTTWLATSRPHLAENY